MRIIFTAGLLMCSLLISIGWTADAQQAERKDGIWWVQQSKDQHIMYMEGFTDGMKDVHGMVETMKVKKQVAIEKDPVTQLSREVELVDTPREQVLYDLHEYCVNHEKFPSDQFVVGLDNFYAQRIHLRIPILKALEVVRMELKGKTKWEIDPHVRALREEFPYK